MEKAYRCIFLLNGINVFYWNDYTNSNSEPIDPYSKQKEKQMDWQIDRDKQSDNRVFDPHFSNERERKYLLLN